MAATEEHSRRDRVIYGPLLTLPRNLRLPAYREVMAGQPVTDPERAAPALAFARRQVRRYTWVAVVCFGFCVLTVAGGIVFGFSPGDASAALLAVYGVISARTAVRARRGRQALTTS